MIYLLLGTLFALQAYLYFIIRREQKRNRILTSFLAGLIVFSKKMPEVIKEMTKQGKDYNSSEAYQVILNDITAQFQKDFWIEPYKKFLAYDRNLFYDEKMANDGFNWIYWDFHDRLSSEWTREEPKNESGDKTK